MAKKLKVFPTKHSYYMTEGSYYSNDCHEDFDNFEDFLSNWGDADIDMNRVHRFDWEQPEQEEGEEPAKPTLKLYYIMQRKAKTYSVYIELEPTEENQEKVRKFLQPYVDYNRKLWE